MLSNLLADEDEFDRRALWRIASWGFGATGAVVLAVMANQSSFGLKRDQVAAADLTRQAQQIQTVAKDTHNEARRLAAAIETLNTDRDRLYSRVTSLEQGLDSVTGAIARQGSNPASPAAPSSPPSPPVATAPATTSAAPAADKSAAAPPTAEPGPAVAAPIKEAVKPEPAKAEAAEPEPMAKGDRAKLAKAAKPSPATPLMASRSIMAPPDPAASKLVEPGKALGGDVIAGPLPDVVAAAPSDTDADDDGAPKASLQRTEFGVDVGGANSVNGLRALWRGLLKSRSNAPLVGLRPIIVIKEGTNGLGMQLRLVAGPLNDAGAAAKICAVLTENKRPCETAVFEGQRLSVQDDPPAAAKPAPRRHSAAKRAAVVVEEAPKPEPPPAATPTTFSSIFSRKNPQSQQ